MGIAYFRTLGHRSPHIRMHTPNEPADHLAVWLDGVKDVGTRPGPQIESYLLNKGDFLKVTYVSGEFNGAGAARLLADFCSPYKLVTLIGASGGGLLAYDTLRLLAMKDCHLILIDAPFEGSDISSAGAKRVADWVPSWMVLPTFINGKLAGRSPLQPELSLTTRERALITTHHQRVARLSIGSVASRLRFVYGHAKPLPRHLHGVPVAILHSKHDPVVRAAAQQKWAAACDSATITEVDVMGHVAMLEQPGTWRAAIGHTFETFEAS